MRACFGVFADQRVHVSLSEGGRMRATIEGSSSDDLLALFDRALKKAGTGKHALRAVAVDRGPDGFSAVRRRVAVAVGLASALGLPIAAISGLDPQACAELPDAAFSRAPVHPLYAAGPNITASKKRKTWTVR